MLITHFRMRCLRPILTLLLFIATASAEPKQVVPAGTLSAPEATQAAAADDRFVYAIASAKIAQYDRASGERKAISTGDAKHLNSGFVWEGRVYCAHSNFPTKPEHSEIKVLDPATMQLSTFKDFGASEGSLTWAVREGESWWCTFAYYGADNARTRLTRFTANWKETGSWVYPPEVVKELGEYSISGGIWKNGDLLVTGHDRRVIYRLSLPAEGDTLVLKQVLPSPFPGQGIAADPVTGGLLGIDRKKQQVVFGKFVE